MQIERIENAVDPLYVLRYRDQQLSLSQRQRFEALIEDDHGMQT